MSSQKIFGAIAAIALLAATQDSADAQYYSGNYSTFYQPYTSFYGGPTTAYYGGGGGCCGTGGYTSYYGGSYGYGGNPFAPLVPSPYSYGWFGSGYTAAYGPTGYGYGYGGCCAPTCCSPCSTGCSPCGTGGCATGNCSIPTSSENLRATPDDGVPMDDEGPMRTYEDSDTTPMDSEGFRPGSTGPEGSEFKSFEGGIESNESFRIDPRGTGGNEGPAVPSQPDEPLDADKPETNGSSVPETQLELYVPSDKPISPRNSAQVLPATHLDRRITWRSHPVIVPERQQLNTSRPLVVRKTVKLQLTPAPTLVSQSDHER